MKVSNSVKEFLKHTKALSKWTKFLEELKVLEKKKFKVLFQQKKCVF